MLLYVPFVDAVNTMSDASIPLTCTEWEEIGNPNEREAFYYMLEPLRARFRLSSPLFCAILHD